MARSTGPLHSDQARGSAGNLTHRVYRGTGTVSRHRSPSRIKRRRASIVSPQQIPGCFSYHTAAVGYLLRVVGSLKYLVSLQDLAGGFGQFLQSIAPFQPQWISSDPLHGNRPYLLFDGVDDGLPTTPLVPRFSAPLDVWVVASDCGIPSSDIGFISFSSSYSRYLYCDSSPAIQWGWVSPAQYNLKPHVDLGVRVWRIVFSAGTIQIFINGVAQTLPKTITTTEFNRILYSFVFVSGHAYPGKLFDIATWRRILNPVEVALLLRYYTETFNI